IFGNIHRDPKRLILRLGDQTNQYNDLSRRSHMQLKIGLVRVLCASNASVRLVGFRGLVYLYKCTVIVQ
ncbi:MAG TPA: hypothetical protein PKE31_21515, partial [Pseudomonadota bacterium]|nr:hypothetical protein [Pseudomonadota bacterium]